MNLYLLFPLLSCIACSALAVAVLARDTTRRASRICAATAICGAWWALCEVLWNTASDPESALLLVTLSAPGWMLIGPAVLHLCLELAGHPHRESRGLLGTIYGFPCILVVVDVTTTWIHTTAVRTTWGWGWEVGPLFPVAFLLSSGTVAAGLLVAWQGLRRYASPAEVRQSSWLFAGLLVPLTVASFTDGVAPLLGIQLPRLGAASISLLAVSMGWTFHRFGYSMLAPGAFATEILATLPDGVTLLRLDGIVHSANAGMGRLLCVAPAALEGRSMKEFIEPASFDLEDPVRERECSLTPEGHEPVPVSICTSVVRDKQKNPIGLVLVARDLREITSLRSRLITSGRLASVGQLAAGIAHEINNPVAYVRANLGSLAGLLDEIAARASAADVAEELSEGRELIEESLEGVDRVASIVRDVKSFSREGEAGLELIEIHPMLESVLRVAGPQLRYGARVVSDFQEVPLVRGSSQELKQVFLNLVMNASQAVGDEGEIRLLTRVDGDQVVVEVCDDGCGIPPSQLARVFDPFFTTKPVGEGTGLGLSISYQIVEGHQGSLSVTSSPGEGTAFRVELPAADLAS